MEEKVHFSMVMKNNVKPFYLKDFYSSSKYVNFAYVGSKCVYLNFSLDIFVKNILKELNGCPIDAGYSADILIKLCHITRNITPRIVLKNSNKVVEAHDLNIVLGAGSNNLDLGNSNDYFIESMKYWRKESLERIYVEVNGKEKFTYYIDLKNKKRFLKDSKSVKNFVHFEIFKKKELLFLKTDNEEDVYNYRL